MIGLITLGLIVALVLLLTLPSHLPSALHARNDNVALSANESSGQVATCEQHLSVSQAKQYTGATSFHVGAQTGFDWSDFHPVQRHSAITTPTRLPRPEAFPSWPSRRHCGSGSIRAMLRKSIQRLLRAGRTTARIGLLSGRSRCRSGSAYQMQRLGILKPSPPAALPVPYRVGGEISMTKRAGRVAFSGRLAQLVRAAGLQPAGRGFESLSAHHCDVADFLGHVNPQRIIRDLPWKLTEGSSSMWRISAPSSSKTLTSRSAIKMSTRLPLWARPTLTWWKPER